MVGIDPARPDVATNRDRVAHVDALQVEIDGLLADRKAEDVLADLGAAGVPAGRIRTVPEVYDWEQVRHLGLVHQLQHATLGDGGRAGRRRCATTARPPASDRPPPLLGEHEDLVWDRPWLDQHDRGRGGMSAVVRRRRRRHPRRGGRPAAPGEPTPTRP